MPLVCVLLCLSLCLFLVAPSSRSTWAHLRVIGALELGRWLKGRECRDEGDEDHTYRQRHTCEEWSLLALFSSMRLRCWGFCYLSLLHYFGLEVTNGLVICLFRFRFSFPLGSSSFALFGRYLQPSHLFLVFFWELFNESCLLVYFLSGVPLHVASSTTPLSPVFDIFLWRLKQCVQNQRITGKNNLSCPDWW